MANYSPLGSTVSFDDLLKANKQALDQIFSAQTKELGLLSATHRPPTSTDLVVLQALSTRAGGDPTLLPPQ